MDGNLLCLGHSFLMHARPLWLFHFSAEFHNFEFRCLSTERCWPSLIASSSSILHHLHRCHDVALNFFLNFRQALHSRHRFASKSLWPLSRSTLSISLVTWSSGHDMRFFAWGRRFNAPLIFSFYVGMALAWWGIFVKTFCPYSMLACR